MTSRRLMIGVVCALLVSLLGPRPAVASLEGESVVVLGGSGVISPDVFDHLSACADGSAVRFAGADRYATAVEVSTAHFGAGEAGAVYVATGEGYADAVAAAPAAALQPGPVLLTRGAALPSVTADELVRLDPETIYVLGGTEVIGPEVEASLTAIAPTVRLAGQDRYSTAAEVARARFDSSAVVYVAAGADYPDALTGSVGAAVDGGPILLIRQGEIPASTAAAIERLAPGEVVILGGTAAVSDTVEADLGALVPRLTRLAGADRFATAVAVSNRAAPSGGTGVYIATASDFPDALVAGAAAGAQGAPILLVKRFIVPQTTAAEIARVLGRPCAPLDATPSLTVITDSVVLGARRYLPAGFPEWHVEVLGNPALMIHQVEEKYLPAGSVVGEHIALGLGYNSLWERNRGNYDKWAARFDSQAEDLLDALRAHGAEQVAWVTLREPDPSSVVTAQQKRQYETYAWYFPYVNERLRLIAARHPDVVLADWAAVSSGSGLTYDLFHLNPDGARLMTSVISEALGG